MRRKRTELAGWPLAPLLWAPLKAKQICLRPSGDAERGCYNLPRHHPARARRHVEQEAGSARLDGRRLFFL